MRAFKAVLLILVSLLFSLSSNQGLLLAQTTPEKPPVVEVPMLFRGTMPAVEVMVNGQGPFVFAIDTGAQGTARVDSSLAEKLKLSPTGQIQASDASGRNFRSLDLFVLDSVVLGGIQFKGVEAASRNYSTFPGMPKIDGMLAFNLFTEYLLTLDFPAKRVRLERGELPVANGAEILSFDNPQGVPVIELSVGDHKIKAHLDSGNIAGGFILPTALVEKLTLTSSPIVVGRASTVSNDVEVKEARLKNSIRLGRFEFAEPKIMFPALSADANVGASVLREFTLTFDQKNKRMSLKRQVLPKVEGQLAAVGARDFKDYSGHYGERTVTAEDGALFLQRQGGPKLKLAPVAVDEFSLERIPEARIKFVRSASGKVVAINVLTPAGEWEKAIKEQP